MAGYYKLEASTDNLQSNPSRHHSSIHAGASHVVPFKLLALYTDI